MVKAESRSTSVSVIIPVRDGAELLDLQLARVLGQKCEQALEVLVADNGSRDAVPDIVNQWRCRDQRIRLIDASARPGAAAARNIGASVAVGGLLLFCDADDLVEPGWVSALSSALGRSDIAAGFIDFTTLNPGPSKIPRDPTPHQFRYLPAGLGANLGVRSNWFTRVGGFDESLTAGEDLDLCWRLQTAGASFTSVADAVVQKRDRTGSRSRARQAIEYGRCDPALFRRHRSEGMPRNVWLAAKTWGWIICNIPLLGNPRRRRTWAHAVGLRTGRLLGSLRYRVMYP